MKVYTKRGDRGTTSLTGGERVSKSDVRVEAYGTVDELMANVALLADRVEARGVCADIVVDLRGATSTLMTISAILSQGEGVDKVSDLEVGSVESLERRIDAISEGLAPITTFTLPGGDDLVSQCHICRTVCRRAERRVVALCERFEVSANVTGYINRLSDYLYVAGRELTKELNVKEILWVLHN